MRRLLLTISAIAAALTMLAGAGVAAAADDPPDSSRPAPDPRLMHWPDLEIAPYVLHESPNTTSVVIHNSGNAQSAAAVLTWVLTKEVINSCWCLAWGDVPVGSLQPGGWTTVDMCAELKQETSWLDDGFLSTDLEFDVAQIAGAELDLSDNHRILHIACTA